MKKTLAAVAVLGAFAGSALAADVTLYGRVDAGLNYTNSEVEYNGAAGKVDTETDQLTVKSGQYTGSRWGIKGSEQISEGLTVGFQLENGFTTDDGKIGQNGGIFGREARVYLTTEFGEIAFGRMGGLDSGSGSYDMIGDASVFSTGWGGATMQMSNVFKGKSDRYDNMITYKSPKFAGLTVLAQASLKESSSADGDEGLHTADRYYALGIEGSYGAFSGALVYSMQDFAGLKDRYTGAGVPLTKDDINDDDGYAITAFGSYDFGVTKVSLGAQYFDNVAQKRGSLEPSITWDETEWVSEYGDVDFGLTGYGVILSAVTPVAGGSLYTGIGYGDYEQAMADVGEKEDTTEVLMLGVGYDYPLSKRTKLYTAVGYTQQTKNAEEPGSKDVDTTTTEVMFGMAHYF